MQHRSEDAQLNTGYLRRSLKNKFAIQNRVFYGSALGPSVFDLSVTTRPEELGAARQQEKTKTRKRRGAQGAQPHGDPKWSRTPLGPSVFDLSVSGRPRGLKVAGGREKTKTRIKRAGGLGAQPQIDLESSRRVLYALSFGSRASPSTALYRQNSAPLGGSTPPDGSTLAYHAS